VNPRRRSRRLPRPARLTGDRGRRAEHEHRRAVDPHAAGERDLRLDRFGGAGARARLRASRLELGARGVRGGGERRRLAERPRVVAAAPARASSPTVTTTTATSTSTSVKPARGAAGAGVSGTRASCARTA
jgi:hypothetical protein